MLRFLPRHHPTIAGETRSHLKLASLAGWGAP